MIAWVEAQLAALEQTLAQYAGPEITGIEQLAQYRNDPQVIAHWRALLTRIEMRKDLEAMRQSTGLTFHRHTRYVCPETCQGCPICAGELFMCSVCGLAEVQLTTHCPGVPLTGWLADEIGAGVLDYQHGAWVERVSTPADAGLDALLEPEALVV
jgi:hypothetical protein